MVIFGTEAYSHAMFFVVLFSVWGCYRFICRSRVLAGDIGHLRHSDKLCEVVGP